MFKMVCQRDFVLDCGTVAFVAGREYEWRWATGEEYSETGCSYMFSNEQGFGHLMSDRDVEEAFRSSAYHMKDV